MGLINFHDYVPFRLCGSAKRRYGATTAAYAPLCLLST